MATETAETRRKRIRQIFGKRWGATTAAQMALNVTTGNFYRAVRDGFTPEQQARLEVIEAGGPKIIAEAIVRHSLERALHHSALYHNFTTAELTAIIRKL